MVKRFSNRSFLLLFFSTFHLPYCWSIIKCFPAFPPSLTKVYKCFLASNLIAWSWTTGNCQNKDILSLHSGGHFCASKDETSAPWYHVKFQGFLFLCSLQCGLKGYTTMQMETHWKQYMAWSCFHTSYSEFSLCCCWFRFTPIMIKLGSKINLIRGWLGAHNFCFCWQKFNSRSQTVKVSLESGGPYWSTGPKPKVGLWTVFKNLASWLSCFCGSQKCYKGRIWLRFSKISVT